MLESGRYWGELTASYTNDTQWSQVLYLVVDGKSAMRPYRMTVNIN